jgi:hypothetical protein
MALRPVSELGLMDLTDLAEPGKSKGKAAPAKGRPAPTKPQQSAKSKKAAEPPARTPSPRARTKGAGRAARTGMVVATWTLAGACGVVLGRAAVRR